MKHLTIRTEIKRSRTICGAQHENNTGESISLGSLLADNLIQDCLHFWSYCEERSGWVGKHKKVSKHLLLLSIFAFITSARFTYISALQTARESPRAARVQILIWVERVKINFKAFLLLQSLNGQIRREQGLAWYHLSLWVYERVGGLINTWSQLGNSWPSHLVERDPTWISRSCSISDCRATASL